MVSIELKDWKEVTKGIYVNPISANAELYIVRDWHEKDGRNIREREILLDYASVMDCIWKAVEDDKENNSTE